jgi:hypothetical protein
VYGNIELFIVTSDGTSNNQSVKGLVILVDFQKEVRFKGQMLIDMQIAFECESGQINMCVFFLVRQPPSGPGPPHSRGFQITNSDAPQSVGHKFYVVRTVHFGMNSYNEQRNVQVFNLFIYLLLPYMFRAFF